MDIEEIRVKKLKLEKGIEILCAEFTKDADIAITHVHVGAKWMESCGKPLAKISVVLEPV
jgi:hypothetical protein